MMADPGGIWSKIDVAVLAVGPATTTGAAAASPPAAQAPRKSAKWRFWVLDAIATALWLYAAIKVFVFDIDAYLVHLLVPQARWVLDYRFLIFLVLLAMASALARKWRFLGGLLYVTFFPVVVVAWKIPRFLYRRRSWVAVFAVLNILTNLIRNYRYNLVVAAAALVAAFVIGASSWGLLVVVAAGVWATLLILSFGRAIWFSLNPSKFVDAQVTVLDKLVMSDTVAQQFWLAKDDWRTPQVKKLSRDQLTDLMQRMAQGVILNRVVYWWAYHLDSYRRSPAPFLFNALTYLWLFVEAVVAYALINAALFKVEPDSFRYSSAPGAFDFVHYAINTLLVGTVDYLSPRTPVALAIFDAAHLTGILFLVTFFATLFFVIRQTKQDQALQSSVETFRQRGREFEERFKGQYEVTIAEAIDRLKELGSGLIGIIAFFTTRIPPGFESGDQAESGSPAGTGRRTARR